MTQGQFNFDGHADPTGLADWRARRQAAEHALARSLGLPLGHVVEVWLRGEIRLRGRLRLREEWLFLDDLAPGQLQLVVDNVVFSPAEIESCLRLEDAPASQETAAAVSKTPAPPEVRVTHDGRSP